jgi:hypothetical protein
MRSPTLAATLMLPALLITGCHKKAPADPVHDQKVPATDAAANHSNSLPLVDSFKLFRADKGKPAPTEEFTGPGGIKTNLAQFTGKPLIVYFWVQAFSDSVAQLPDLDALAAAGKIAVVPVNIDDTVTFPDNATPQWAALKLGTLKDYRDSNKVLAKALEAPAAPVAILYDSTGHQVLQIRGTAHYSTAEISALLAEAK